MVQGEALYHKESLEKPQLSSETPKKQAPWKEPWESSPEPRCLTLLMLANSSRAGVWFLRCVG